MGLPDEDDILSPEERAKVLAEINKRATMACPRCGSNSWQIVPGYSQVFAQKDPVKRDPQASFLPIATVVCATCGFLSQHALQNLGLWEAPKKE